MPNEYILWTDEKFEVITLENPHIASEEGLHVIITPKRKISSAWADPKLCGETFELAARICQVMEKLKLAPWFNLQAGGNWQLLPGGTLQFHVHIYARRKGKTWGMPVQLPLAPGTFHNYPMTPKERDHLSQALKAGL